MRSHLCVRDHVVMNWAPALYLIRVDGHLGVMALSGFAAMTPQRKGAHTVLTGWLDQSALYGVLAEMEALGLVLLEVRQLGPQRANHQDPVMSCPPPSGDPGRGHELAEADGRRDVPRESREKQ